jgi:chromosome segregation ATPase
MGILDAFSGDDQVPDREKMFEEEETLLGELQKLQEKISDARDVEAEMLSLVRQGDGELARRKIEEKLKDLLIFVEDDVKDEEGTVRSQIGKLEELQDSLEPVSPEHEKLDNLLEDSLRKVEEERTRLEQIAEEIETALNSDGGMENEELISSIRENVSELEPEERALANEVESAQKLLEGLEQERARAET